MFQIVFHAVTVGQIDIFSWTVYVNTYVDNCFKSNLCFKSRVIIAGFISRVHLNILCLASNGIFDNSIL